MALTYCCCRYCLCCDEFISSSQPDLTDFLRYRFGVIFRGIASLSSFAALIDRSHLNSTASLLALLYVCCVIQHHMLIHTLRLLICGVKLFDEDIAYFATMHAQQPA
jgi:hypothetical protein